MAGNMMAIGLPPVTSAVFVVMFDKLWVYLDIFWYAFVYSYDSRRAILCVYVIYEQYVISTMIKFRASESTICPWSWLHLQFLASTSSPRRDEVRQADSRKNNC
jgi:hypothetical protein